jgi:NitT/TauT family transport system substrate-binding protein
VPLPPPTLHTLSRRGLLAGAGGAALAVATGCSGGDGNSDDDGQTTPDQVTYLTGFQASAHDAFIFVADEKGYFRDSNIQIDIQLGGGEQNNAALLADQAQFTYTEFTGHLLDIGAGTIAAGDFRALCSIHQTTLVAIVAPPDSGIESPQDLTGKRIGCFAGSPTQELLPAYADVAGWEFDEELVVGVGIQDLFGLIPSGQADCLSSFIIQKGVIEVSAGAQPGSFLAFPFNEVLDDLLGTGLISTAALADQNPDLVARFRDAALEGVRYTIDNPEEAIQILSERNPGAVEVPEAFVAQIGVMTPYITGRGEDQIGTMDEAQVMRCISVLESSGLIPSGQTPASIIGEGTLLTST